jgi:radical SAM superfamily enzyme YgiQ (UPF0313 family)
MRALIYKPGLNDGSQNELPNLGMAILAKELKGIGYDVTIYDGHFQKLPEIDIMDLITASDLVCFSLVSQEWELKETQWAINIAHAMHKKVMIGGPHAYAYWDILQEDERITHLIVGEADGNIDEIINNPCALKVQRPGSAKGFTAPDFSDLIGKEDILGDPLYTSRGCTNLCNFCMGGKIHRGWRARSLGEDFWEEIRGLAQFTKLKRVYIVDDCFSADLEHAKMFLRGWFVNGYSDKYELKIMNVRADQIDLELLLLMKMCKVEELPIGVESADPEVFRHVGKGETLEDIKRAIAMIQEAGIIPWLNMIVGLPHDNPKRHQNSLNWILDIPGRKIVHWFQFAPFRNTKAYDWLLRHGYIGDGYIPKAYGRRYDEFPWYPDFRTSDFSEVQRARAQLEGYLMCESPIVMNTPNLWKVSCELGLGKEYRHWEETADIEEYTKKHLEFKKERGQV